MPSDYSRVAHEYYDAELHPTCHNFGLSNKLILENFWPEILRAHTICEVGAGRSGLLEYSNGSLNSVFVADKSVEMLEHSKSAFGLGNFYVVSEAESLPLLAESIDLIVSLLGDPYNTPQFWLEASRILRKDGHILFTTPSWEWSEKFRNSAISEKPDSALFVLSDGTELYVPSRILNRQSQLELAANHGFALQGEFSVTQGDLALDKGMISSKIQDYLDDDIPFVSAYFLRKH